MQKRPKKDPTPPNTANEFMQNGNIKEYLIASPDRWHFVKVFKGAAVRKQLGETKSRATKARQRKKRGNEPPSRALRPLT